MKGFLLVTGVVMIIVGVLGNSLGLSQGSGFGYGQFFVCIVGVLLVTAGFTGKKFPAVYRSASVILMNTVLLILLVEFISLMVTKVFHVGSASSPDPRAAMQSEQIRETGLIFPSREFAPFLTWRSAETSLPLMNIDSNGVRHTAYSCDDAGSLEVLTLGGSAMWGWMVPDSMTIPSLLQRNLNSELGMGTFSVRNYAENGYVSTQDLFQLVLRLQRGDRPCMVIAYNGFNDVLAACENAAAGTVIGQSVIEGFFSRRAAPVSAGSSTLLDFLGGLRTIGVLRSLIPNEQAAQEGPDVLIVANPIIKDEDFDLEALAEETASIYKANYLIVAALSETMGFEYLFVLQPYLNSDVRTLTPIEEEILRNEDPVILELASMVYDEILQDTVICPNIVSLDGALTDVEETVFTDICHMTPAGNEVMADAISRFLFSSGSSLWSGNDPFYE